MNFNPILTIANRTCQRGCFDPAIDDSLCQRILEFVRVRSTAIRNGSRADIDATYDASGLEDRDYSIGREDYERTSYYDWYISRLERGFASDVTEIEVIPVEDVTLLPFRHNVTWPHQPQFELRIRTADSLVSWLVRLKGNQLCVVLPNFCDAPWKEPILDRRGGTVEFNARRFAKELGEHLGLEFCSWSVHLNGLVKIRAFALSVDPYYGFIHPSLLTDKENFDEAQCGKWCIGEWRFHHL